MEPKSKTQNVTTFKNLNNVKTLKNLKLYKTEQLKHNKTKTKIKCDKTKKNQFVTNLIIFNCERKKLINLKFLEKN